MAGSKRVTRQRNIRESNPTGCGKDEKGSQSVKNQQGVDETWMKSSVEEIKDVVTTFTQFMMGNTPTFNTIQAQPGIPRLLPSTPRASSVNMRTEPESMVARKTPSSERWTTSATPLKFSSKECSEFPSDDVTVGQKHYVKEGQDLVYYVNYDPLHCTQSEGRKSGFQLLEWVDMLFKPPRYMVLDEIEATVATYIFGSNKDDKVSGKEVLIKSSWGVGERTALKSLMPKKFLDQEA
ncbi:hypothetical protein SESBI_17743 [Sesbania bispinosa]|nr:hypothetical protein SESBI_17743 [Sesbania bispinosa]